MHDQYRKKRIPGMYSTVYLGDGFSVETIIRMLDEAAVRLRKASGNDIIIVDFSKKESDTISATLQSYRVESDEECRSRVDGQPAPL